MFYYNNILGLVLCVVIFNRCIAVSTFLKPTVLNMYEGKYIYLIVGNPAKYVKMRVNFAIDKTILYGDIVDSSQTYSFYDRVQKIGSELFYIGEYKMRLPIVSDKEHSFYSDLDNFVKAYYNNSISIPQDTNKFISTDMLNNFKLEREMLLESNDRYYDGIFQETGGPNAEIVYGDFAMGPGSKLWKFWSNCTVTVDSVILGHYDRFSEINDNKIEARLEIIHYDPLWLFADEGQRQTSKDKNIDSKNTHNLETLDSTTFLKSGAKIFNSIKKLEKIKRGSFVVEGYVDGEKYYIVIDYESPTTLLPKHLQQRKKFTIDFYQLLKPQVKQGLEQSSVPYKKKKHSYKKQQWKKSRLSDADIELLDVFENNRDDSKYSNTKSETAQNRIKKCLERPLWGEEKQEQCVHTSFVFDSKYNSVYIKNGKKYNIIYDSDRRDLIILGRHSAKHLSVFINRMDKSLILSQSYHYYIKSITNYYMIMCFISFIVVWWLLTLNFERIHKTKDRHRKSIFINIFFIIQMLLSIYILTSSVILVYGYNVQRYMKHYLKTYYHEYVLYLMIWFCVLIALYNFQQNILVFKKYMLLQKKCLYTTTSNGATDENEQNNEKDEKTCKSLNKLIRKWERALLLKRLMVETCSLIIIWLCLAKHHQTTIDIFYLTYIGVMIAVTSTFQTLESHYEYKTMHGKKRPWPFYLLSIISYIFLHFYNIIPLIDNLWNLESILKHQIAFIFWFSTIFGICIYLFSSYKIKIL